MAFESIQKLMEIDPGSQMVFQLNDESELECINLQTSLMTKVFVQYPEVQLIMRSHNNKGKALYTFLADGPRLKTENYYTRIVHIAVPKNETPEGLALMFNHLKDYNPKWEKIRIFLVDPNFKGANVIADLFPSAEVIYSVFHICKFFQRKISEQFLSDQKGSTLMNTLKKCMNAPTEENLQKLHTVLKSCLKLDRLTLLMLGCLLVGRIWDLHRWRVFNVCLIYFSNMEVISHDISEIFRKKQSLKSNIIAVVNYIREHTGNWGVPDLRKCIPSELSLLNGKQGGTASQGIAEASEKESETAEFIRKSIDRICIPGASELCMNELSVALNAEQLISTDGDKVNIQLLENPQQVIWKDPKRCNCHFNKCLQLPCRHIQAVLNVNKEDVKPEMIPSYWQKQSAEVDSPIPVSPDILEIMNSESKDIPEDQLRANCMGKQIMRLLAECSDEVFQQRYNTLRELADAWIGPYEQVKL
ncbi:zinc finger SWIM domain-containing protein 1-like isoform 1-T2 [Discoglossus pictus]